MSVYKIMLDGLKGIPCSLATTREGGNLSIPLDLSNSDCARFLREWKNGDATVTDADDQIVAYSDDAVRALGLDPDSIHHVFSLGV